MLLAAYFDVYLDLLDEGLFLDRFVRLAEDIQPLSVCLSVRPRPQKEQWRVEISSPSLSELLRVLHMNMVRSIADWQQRLCAIWSTAFH